MLGGFGVFLSFFIIMGLSHNFLELQIQEEIQVSSSKTHDKTENNCSRKLTLLPKCCLMITVSSSKTINLAYIKILCNTSQAQKLTSLFFAGRAFRNLQGNHKIKESSPNFLKLEK